MTRTTATNLAVRRARDRPTARGLTGDGGLAVGPIHWVISSSAIGPALAARTGRTCGSGVAEGLGVAEGSGEGDGAGTDEPDRAAPRTRCGNSLPGSSSVMRVIPPAVRTYGHASARYSGAQDERLFKRDDET